MISFAQVFRWTDTRALLLWRIIGVVLFIGLFSLPLHSHASAPADESQECTCLHSSVQLLAAAEVIRRPFDFTKLVSVEIQPLIRERRVDLHDVRAPPSSVL